MKFKKLKLWKTTLKKKLSDESESEKLEYCN